MRARILPGWGAWAGVARELTDARRTLDRFPEAGRRGGVMGQTIGEILGFAIGVAISPVPIIALILMLLTPKARGNGLAFLVGWVLGLAAVGGIALVIAGTAGISTSSGASNGADTFKLVLGLLFLFLAVRQWRKRPAPGTAPPMPKWMTSLDRFTPGRSFAVAAALSGLNPKNLMLNLAAAATIAQSALPGTQQALVLGVFIVVASLGVIAPYVVYLGMGDRAAATLDGWKAWLVANNAAVMAVLFLVFGFVLIGKGLALTA
jgi:MFS family permease